MNKTILVLCAILLFAKGEIDSVKSASLSRNEVIHTDDYIKMHLKQHSKTLQEYDSRLEYFRERFLRAVDEIHAQVDMLTATLVTLDNFVNASQVSSDLSKRCANKYRFLYPTNINISLAINNCVVEAPTHIENLLSSLLSTRHSLENFYTNKFEKEIKKCGKNHDKTTTDYTYCITALTFNINAHAIINQKLFNTQMEAAECTANAIIKNAVDCAYTIQTRTNMLAVEAYDLINKCLEGRDECKPCSKDFICPEVYNMQVDHEVGTIPNPFYRKKNATNCLMLNIVKS